MLIQNNYDLTLIGNIIVDEVYYTSKCKKWGTSNTFSKNKISIGGIGNILESLKDSNLKLFVQSNIGNDNNGKLIKQYLNNLNIKANINITNNATSKALILSDLISKERTSFVNWGCAIDDINLVNYQSNWTHISYLDTCILNLDNIANCSKIISADLCLSNPSKQQIKSIKSKLSYLDYLFVSESEIYPLIGNNDIVTGGLQLITKYGLRNIICHTREKTYIINKNFNKEIIGNHNTIENINVLGAGDAYCAYFILNYLQQYNIEDVVKQAHKQATNFIYSRR